MLPLNIGNTGDGTLAFEFPDYVDNSGDSPLAYCAATATACDEFIGNVHFRNDQQYQADVQLIRQLYSSYPLTLIKGVSYSYDSYQWW